MPVQSNTTNQTTNRSDLALSRDSRWTGLPLLTPSSVSDLILCGKKYDTLRVRKLWPKNRPAPPVTVPRGSAWHETLRALHAARWTDADGVCQIPIKDVEAFAASAVYAARYERDVDREAEIAIVSAMTLLLVDNTDPEDLQAIIALETQSEFDYNYMGEPLVRIAGTIDRVLIRDPGVLVIQDFKSTRQTINLAECFLLIWIAARKWPGYKYVLELIWVDFEDGQVSVDYVTQDMVRSQHKILTSALLKRKAEVPIADPGPACTFCPIRESCMGLDSVDLAEDEVPF